MESTGDLSPEQRLAEMEAAVASLGELVNKLPDKDDAERAVRIERAISRLLVFAIVPTILVLGILALLFAGIYNAKDMTGENRKGIRCVLEQLSEHRQVNDANHEAFGRQLGVPKPEGQEHLAPRSVPQELLEACDPFYEDDSGLPKPEGS